MLEKGQRKEGRGGKTKWLRNLTIRLGVSYFKARLLGISPKEATKKV